MTGGEAQVFVDTHTTISGHRRVPLLGQAELWEQATGRVYRSCSVCLHLLKYHAVIVQTRPNRLLTDTAAMILHRAVEPQQNTI